MTSCAGACHFSGKRRLTPFSVPFADPLVHLLSWTGAAVTQVQLLRKVLLKFSNLFRQMASRISLTRVM